MAWNRREFRRYEKVREEALYLALDPTFATAPPYYRRKRPLGVMEGVVAADGSATTDVHLLGACSNELKRRHAAWAAWDRVMEQNDLRRGAVAASVVLGTGVAVTAWEAASPGYFTHVVACSLVVLPCVWIAIARANRAGVHDIYLKRLGPRCGYDLSGSPDAVPPHRPFGVHVGPPACSECACPWPLVASPASLEFEPQRLERIRLARKARRD